jgi:hypothetical protein
MLAGEWIATDWTPKVAPTWTWATAGFGVVEKDFHENEKRWVKTRRLLTAAHAGEKGSFIYRIASPEPISTIRSRGEKIGWVDRDPYHEGAKVIDALAIHLDGDGLAPKRIFGEGGNRPPIGPAGVAREGKLLCASGAKSERVKCGHVIGFNHVNPPGQQKHICVTTVLGLGTRKGDSGAPVWNPRTGQAIGLMQGYPRHGNLKRRFVQPLLTTPIGKERNIPGALHASIMGDLNMITGP